MGVDGADERQDRPPAGLTHLAGALRHLHRGDSRGGGEPGQGQLGHLFVDDVTWLVEGTDLSDVVDKLERYVAASLQ